MNKQEILIEVFNKVGSIAKTADFVVAGLKNYEVVSLCNQGYVERIRNGFYKLPNTDEPSEEILISKLLPQGIRILQIFQNMQRKWVFIRIL